jgi:hypothetical protein
LLFNIGFKPLTQPRAVSRMSDSVNNSVSGISHKTDAPSLFKAGLTHNLAPTCPCSSPLYCLLYLAAFFVLSAFRLLPSSHLDRTKLRNVNAASGPLRKRGYRGRCSSPIHWFRSDLLLLISRDSAQESGPCHFARSLLHFVDQVHWASGGSLLPVNCFQFHLPMDTALFYPFLSLRRIGPPRLIRTYTVRRTSIQ